MEMRLSWKNKGGRCEEAKPPPHRFPTSRQISIVMLHTQHDSDDEDPTKSLVESSISRPGQ